VLCVFVVSCANAGTIKLADAAHRLSVVRIRCGLRIYASLNMFAEEGISCDGV
jgi:hypothetical protein